ncbi:MAG: FemAB family protein [Microgenomates group bacterium GW2011_GWC1_37_8]|uniref:FemAB family protein n=1 Tax=Candidatus Woesebacteria bacterium GW2011_GWB1_38_8 TaxID=1618570 RepID=A0A0G0P9W8_9BACT|nr:MAG: FemAB family protein [Microgenomates group bacterium GW2011_GWC1_37_8]KKQ86086.1 MAG: FemAB family protein [Candidatus Woesebacteria bacterium GW2011_GWB1_38_8]
MVDKKFVKNTVTHPLQSKEWGEFRKAWGNEIVWTKWGMLTLHNIPFTKYKIGMFIKGPVPSQEMLTELKTLGRKHELIFIKLEPNVPIAIRNTQNEKRIKNSYHVLRVAYNKDNFKQLFQENSAVPGKTLFTPTTFWIDLTRPEDDILKSFSSKTRYNIRLAQKHGIEVVEDNSDKAFEKYIQLTRETVERQGFYAHTEKYHRLMWEFLHKRLVANDQRPIARLLVARYKGQIITAWIILVWHQFLYYPYGASSDKYKNVMANNLMMWEAIRYGKKLGLKTFDLWGREEGKGFTRFKEGYNPKVVEFLGTWDLITSPLYWPYRIAEAVRWRILRARSKFIKPTF